jgi:CRP-like cAMP-binding protein
MPPGDLLDGLGALADLAPAEREALAGLAREQAFEPGEHLLREGDPADAFFVVCSGGVAVETHVPGRGAVTLETLHDGDVLGWSWMVPPHRTAFDARALEATRVLVFDGPQLRARLDREPALASALLRVLVAAFTQRLQDARLRLLDLYAPPHA